MYELKEISFVLQVSYDYTENSNLIDGILYLVLNL